MATRPSAIVSAHQYGVGPDLFGFLDVLARNGPLDREAIIQATARHSISSDTGANLVLAMAWPERATNSIASDDAADGARTVIAALADGNTTLSEAGEMLLALAVAGRLGTGKVRRDTLRFAAATLRAVADAMGRILSPEGRAARDVIARRYHRAAGGRMPELASVERLAVRRESVQAVARWAELIATTGMAPMAAARVALAGPSTTPARAVA